MHQSGDLLRAAEVFGGVRDDYYVPPESTAVRINVSSSTQPADSRPVHANWVDAAHIAAQGPMSQAANPEGRAAFFAMLLDADARHIVNLTGEPDASVNNPDIDSSLGYVPAYWPAAGVTERLTVGNRVIDVTTQSVTQQGGYNLVTLEVSDQDRGLSQTVQLYQFTGWRSEDTPAAQDMADFSAFTQTVNAGVGTDTVVVHGNVGVGRAGTFITLRQMLSGIEAGTITEDNLVQSITNLVWEGRINRDADYVQTPPQFTMLIEAGLAALRRVGDGNQHRQVPPGAPGGDHGVDQAAHQGADHGNAPGAGGNNPPAAGAAGGNNPPPADGGGDGGRAPQSGMGLVAQSVVTRNRRSAVRSDGTPWPSAPDISPQPTARQDGPIDAGIRIFQAINAASRDIHLPDDVVSQADLQGGARYGHILPPSASAVEVEVNGVARQTHANWVGDNLIVAQGPMSSTSGYSDGVATFFAMAMDNGVECIVNLTGDSDAAIADLALNYWPDMGATEQHTLGDRTISVTNRGATMTGGFEIITLDLQDSRSGLTQTVEMYRFDGWSSGTVPVGPDRERFIEFMDTFYSDSNAAGTTLIHSGVGVGRAGTFAAINQVFDGIAQGNVTDDNLVEAIRDTVWAGRIARGQAFVTGIPQFAMIVESALAAIDVARDSASGDVSGDTPPPAGGNPPGAGAAQSVVTRNLRPATRSDGSAWPAAPDVSQLPSPRNLLAEIRQSSHRQRSELGRGLFRAMDEDGYSRHLHLPADFVAGADLLGGARYDHILPPAGSTVEVEVNGVAQPTHANWVAPELIVAQGPMNQTSDNPEGVAAFLAMAMDNGVSNIINLTNADDAENGTIETQYWPDPGATVQHVLGDRTISVTNNRVTRGPGREIVNLQLRDSRSGLTHTVDVFHFTGWPDLSVPTGGDRANFIAFMSAFTDRATDGTTLVHSDAGVGRAGTVATMMQLFERITDGHVNDANLMEAVRDLVWEGRIARGPEFAGHISQLAMIMEFGLTAINLQAAAVRGVSDDTPPAGGPNAGGGNNGAGRAQGNNDTAPARAPDTAGNPAAVAAGSGGEPPLPPPGGGGDGRQPPLPPVGNREVDQSAAGPGAPSASVSPVFQWQGRSATRADGSPWPAAPDVTALVSAQIDDPGSVGVELFDALAELEIHHSADSAKKNGLVGGARTYLHLPPLNSLVQVNVNGAAEPVHASWIDSHHIAAQGPANHDENPGGLAAFFAMALDNGARHIVNLTGEEDAASDGYDPVYWPASGVTEQFTVGDRVINVTTQTVVHYRDEGYDIVTLAVREGDQPGAPSQIINLYHFPQWPPFGTPGTAAQRFSNFMSVVNGGIGDDIAIVHSNNGTGRTGTFIALRQLLSGINEGTINQGNLIQSVANLIWEGRINRGAKYVQAASQVTMLIEQGLAEIDRLSSIRPLSQVLEMLAEDRLSRPTPDGRGHQLLVTEDRWRELLAPLTVDQLYNLVAHPEAPLHQGNDLYHETLGQVAAEVYAEAYVPELIQSQGGAAQAAAYINSQYPPQSQEAAARGYVDLNAQIRTALSTVVERYIASAARLNSFQQQYRGEQ